MKNRILSILLLALAALTANAQDFDPNPPAEPNAKYKVTVGISHAAAGTVSGAGSYSTGQQVTIRRNDAYFSSTSTVFYKFKCWTLNGVEYTPAAKSSSFTYTVGTENAAFEAVYEEEDPDNVTSKVFLVADPADACTFNQTSGQRYLEGNYAYIYYNVSSDAFKFQGWYDNNGQQVSTVRSFNYLVGKDDVTLTARFTYEPVVPIDPTGNQDDVANGILGDVNGDNVVDMVDVVALINIYLGKTTLYELSVCDINKDGQVDMVDVVAAINIYLGK